MYQAIEAQRSSFYEISLSPSMVDDHMPGEIRTSALIGFTFHCIKMKVLKVDAMSGQSEHEKYRRVATPFQRKCYTNLVSLAILDLVI